MSSRHRAAFLILICWFSFSWCVLVYLHTWFGQFIRYHQAKGPCVRRASQTARRCSLPKRKNRTLQGFPPKMGALSAIPCTQSCLLFRVYLPSFNLAVNLFVLVLFPAVLLALWSLRPFSRTVLLHLCSFISSFLSIVLPSASCQLSLLQLQRITVTVGLNCSIIYFSPLSRGTVILKRNSDSKWEEDRCDETLCWCPHLDKMSVLVYEEMSVSRQQAHLHSFLRLKGFSVSHKGQRLLYGRKGIVRFKATFATCSFFSVYQRCLWLFFFFTKPVPCLSTWTIRKISTEGTATQKDRHGRHTVACNTIYCFRWQRVSKCESCEVSEVLNTSDKHSVKTIDRDMKVWVRTHRGVT